MPDHPQHTVVEPCGAFRESLLRFIERQELHDAFRQFGDLLQTLVLEAPRYVVGPSNREEPIAGTSTQHESKAILLDLTAVRTDMWTVREGMGNGEGPEASRLALAVADLLPALDGMIGTLRAAVERATVPVFKAAGGAPPITSEMVRDALNDDGDDDGA